MRNQFILTASIAIVFFTPAAVLAEENKSGMTREQAEGFAKDISLVSRQAVLPAVHGAVNNSAAAYWALWDLVNDLSARQKAGGKPEPDANLVETNMRLRMRGDYGKLCSKFSGNCKEYPGDREFSKATQYACKDIKAYAAGFKAAQNFAKKLHRAKIERLLESARDRAMFSLMPTRETSLQTPPPTAGEDKYIQLSLQKKQGEKFTFPPWP